MENNISGRPMCASGAHVIAEHLSTRGLVVRNYSAISSRQLFGHVGEDGGINSALQTGRLLHGVARIHKHVRAVAGRPSVKKHSSVDINVDLAVASAAPLLEREQSKPAATRATRITCCPGMACAS